MVMTDDEDAVRLGLSSLSLSVCLKTLGRVLGRFGRHDGRRQTVVTLLMHTM